MNIDKFEFYKVLKNEDANPYIFTEKDRGFIVAADGLGGAGSFVHELSQGGRGKLKSLKSFLLPEYRERPVDEAFEKWADRQIEPMVDEKSDTSALWGSRVAIIRFAYYMRTHADINLSNEQTRKDIAEFVCDGMSKVAKEYDLKTEGGQKLLTLPTTLAAIHYEIVSEDNVCVEAVWAGDSRAYALIPEQGLKQLSQDDEDDSGSINNLFAVRNGQTINTTIHHKAYVLPKKSCVFVCSDGFFDWFSPIENIGVEACLLECVSESASFEELKRHWYEKYEPTSHDDCSVAFLAFGYDSFAELKQSLAKKAEEVESVFNDYERYKKFVPIVLGQDEAPEIYVKDRAEKRKTEIASRMAQELLSNPASADLTLTPKIRALYDDLSKECDEKTRQKSATKKVELGKETVECLASRPSEARDIFSVKESSSAAAAKIKAVVKAAEECEKSEAKKSETEKKLEDIQKRLEACTAEKAQLKDTIAARAEEAKSVVDKFEAHYNSAKEMLKLAEDCWGKGSEQYKEQKTVTDMYSRHRDHAAKCQKTLYDVKNKLEKNTSIYGYETKLYRCDLHFEEDVNRILSKCREAERDEKVTLQILARNKNDAEAKLKEYRKKVDGLDEQTMVAALSAPDRYFSEKVGDELAQKLRVDAEVVTEDMLRDKTVDYFTAEPQEFAELIDRFMYSENPTVIDSIFNPNRLRICRDFKAVDKAKVEKLSADVERLESQYTDVEALGRHNVDFVFCVDATGSMDEKIREVSNCIGSGIIDGYKCRLNEIKVNPYPIRAKAITFRDYRYDDNIAMSESPVFDISDGYDKFFDYMSNINRMGGGDDPENGLEALSYAMRTDFRMGEGDRQIIVLLSDADAHPLKECANASAYPDDMDDENGLIETWTKLKEACPDGMRMILIAPNDTLYTAIASKLEGCVFVPLSAEKGFESIDYDEIFRFMTTESEQK